jgi:hypothetical protein
MGATTLTATATLTALFLLAQGAAAETVNLSALKDNTLYESAIGATSNGAGEAFFVGNNAGGAFRRGLLAFDVAAQVPAGATIDSVELRLFMSRTIAGPTTIGLHRALADWGEGGSNAFFNEGGGDAARPSDATWLHTFSPGAFWATPGGDYALVASATTSVGGVGAYTWSGPGLVADVQAWLDDPTGNFGWILIGGEDITPSAKRFNSLQNPSASTRPLLVVDFTPVPVPPALALLASGLLVLTGRLRRRAAAACRRELRG